MTTFVIDYKEQYRNGLDALKRVCAEEAELKKALEEFGAAILSPRVWSEVTKVHDDACNDRRCELLYGERRTLVEVRGAVAKYALSGEPSKGTIYPVKIRHPASGIEVVAVDDVDDVKRKLGYYARHPRFVAEVERANR